MSLRQPDEFANLLHTLMTASDALSIYCRDNGEIDLSHFFERRNPRSGLRCFVDAKVAAVNPSFLCHR
jgi:hypothetical protein